MSPKGYGGRGYASSDQQAKEFNEIFQELKRAEKHVRELLARLNEAVAKLDKGDGSVEIDRVNWNS